MEENTGFAGATSDLNSGKQSARKPWLWWLVAGLGTALMLYLLHLICQIPPATRTFVALAATAGALVVGGLATLIFIIPAADSFREVKTEFYSVRAAYLCVIAGLVLFVIVTLGAVIARVMLTTGRL
jgi:hypothetical protein